MTPQEQEDLDFEAGAEDQELRAMRDEANRDADREAAIWAAEEAESQSMYEIDCCTSRTISDLTGDPHADALTENEARTKVETENAESPF